MSSHNTRRQGLAVQFTAQEKAEFLPFDLDNSPLQPDEILSRTVVSVISSGTEIGGRYSRSTASGWRIPGYASISQIEGMGAEVSDLKMGDYVLGGGHRNYQRGKAASFVKAPEGLDPETAVFGRMAKISMPAFVRCEVRPPETLIVTGLGLVGMLAAQIGQSLGYHTLACDLNAKRREIARQNGLKNVLECVPSDDRAYIGKVGFGLDCSGHEQAVLDLCNLARPWGEVAMVGVPWIPRTSLLAQPILHAVFYKCVYLKSGWEINMPPAPHPQSEPAQHAAAMQWLHEGRIKIDPSTYEKVPPTDPQTQYQALLNNQCEALTYLFDWRQI